MRLKEDSNIRELIVEEWIELFEEGRDEEREKAAEKIVKMQEENRKSYNKKGKRQRSIKTEILLL